MIIFVFARLDATVSQQFVSGELLDSCEMFRTRILATAEGVKRFDVDEKLIVGLETGQSLTCRIVAGKSFLFAQRFFLGVDSSVSLKMEP